MFVSTGAKEQILSRRKEEFFDKYIRNLLQEAASLGLDKNQIIEMINRSEE